MRLLFVAPEICAPWTEGRKNFVAQLAAQMHGEDQVLLWTAVPEGHAADTTIPVEVIERRGKAAMLWSLLRGLPEQIERFEPDLVCHFPYGTFRRHRGTVNRALLRAVDRICRRRGRPCLTVMYSVDQYATPSALTGLVSHLALGRRPDWSGHTLDPGISPPAATDPTPLARSPRQILFMAGMWEPTRARVDHVLAVRGLDVLLRAGEALAPAGVELRVASPLLADAECARYLRGHAANRWPAAQLALESTAEKPRAFQQAALFAFPFQHDIEVFTPTSVIESMFLDTPVLLSDIALLRGLAGDGERAWLFAHDDPDDLARVVLAALGDAPERERRARAAREYVDRNWSIAHSAAQLRGIASRILTTSPQPPQRPPAR